MAGKGCSMFMETYGNGVPMPSAPTIVRLSLYLGFCAEVAGTLMRDFAGVRHGT
jgi:hypothetical protein